MSEGEDTAARTGITAGPGGGTRARGRSQGESPAERLPRVDRVVCGRFLAFLIWSIEAEGFVIPTGSMAPTLMGVTRRSPARNADTSTRSTPIGRSIGSRGRGRGPRIRWGTCENCRFEAAVGYAPSFSGDRIYVMKEGVSIPFFPGAAGPSHRWDVAVFKLPEKPEVRFIKRLVGMPDEVLRIQGGTSGSSRQDDSEEFERPLRPLDHQQAMQMMVYDDRHRRHRWAGSRATAMGRRGVRRLDGTPPGTFVPDPRVLVGRAEVSPSRAAPGTMAISAPAVAGTAREETLITDYSSYNTDLTAGDRNDPRRPPDPGSNRTGSAT